MASYSDVFYGHCTFWTDDWELMRTGRNAPGAIPRCPHCGSVGFEMDRSDWWRQIREHEAKGHPGYTAMMEWGRNQCFTNYRTLEAAYRMHRAGESR